MGATDRRAADSVSVFRRLYTIPESAFNLWRPRLAGGFGVLIALPRRPGSGRTVPCPAASRAQGNLSLSDAALSGTIQWQVVLRARRGRILPAARRSSGGSPSGSAPCQDRRNGAFLLGSPLPQTYMEHEPKEHRSKPGPCARVARAVHRLPANALSSGRACGPCRKRAESVLGQENREDDRTG